MSEKFSVGAMKMTPSKIHAKLKSKENKSPNPGVNCTPVFSRSVPGKQGSATPVRSLSRSGSSALDRKANTPQQGSRTPTLQGGSARQTKGVTTPSRPLKRVMSLNEHTATEKQICAGTKPQFAKTRSTPMERTPVSLSSTPCRSDARLNVRLQFRRECSRLQQLPPTPSKSSSVISTPSRNSIKKFHSELDLTKAPSTPECFSAVHLETPKRMDNFLKSSSNCANLVDEEASHLTVGVRVRPLSVREDSDPSVSNVVMVEGSDVTVMSEGISHTFTYDHCFWSCDSQSNQYANQETLFSVLAQPLVDKAFEGYNACLVAYGQTGSGKSYSLMGTDNEQIPGAISKESGIIPRFCHEVFERIASLEDSRVGGLRPNGGRKAHMTVEISYFEIYNEKIHDLLGGPEGKRAPLKVREHPVFGPYVVDLSIQGVASYEDVQGWLSVGNRQRATAATGMNDKSSRSHSIFSVILTQIQEENIEDEAHELSQRSKISLVDLAGSERVAHTQASGDKLREGVCINKSLLILGKVITALAENASGKKRTFVPYRESVLTWLLRESLGGNSRTAMLATISPSSHHVEDTLSTLRYACQARSIVNRVHVNEDPHARLIRDLRAEVEHLRALRENFEKQKSNVPTHIMSTNNSAARHEIQNKEAEIERLRKQLRESVDQLAKAERSWADRLEEAEKCKSAKFQFLKKCGVAVKLDESQPCLVNLADDPTFSGTLLYVLPEGKVHVRGKHVKGDGPEILLWGPLVADEHCIIENSGRNLTLHPSLEAETFVNGIMVVNPTALNHGDRVVIGGNHYFKVNNPHNIVVNPHSQPIDFEFARQELFRVQEERLRAELQEAKQEAVKELEQAKKEAEIQLLQQQAAYEEHIKQLGHTLEEQKSALSNLQKVKDELHSQKIALEAEMQIERTKLAEQDAALDITLTPYQSMFLQEIEDMFESTAEETEKLLQKNSPAQKLNSNALSLHGIQCMLKEATQCCKQLDKSFEFQHQQVIGENGLENKIQVRNKNERKISLWPLADFQYWLERLREMEHGDNYEGLFDTDVKWDDDIESLSPVGKSPRICVNLEPIKRQLNNSIHQLSMETSCTFTDSFSKSSPPEFSQSDDSRNRVQNICQYLQQIDEAVVNLKAICGCGPPLPSNEQRETHHISNSLSLAWAIGDLAHSANSLRKVVLKRYRSNECSETETSSSDIISSEECHSSVCNRTSSDDSCSLTFSCLDKSDVHEADPLVVSYNQDTFSNHHPYMTTPIKSSLKQASAQNSVNRVNKVVRFCLSPEDGNTKSPVDVQT